MALLWAMWIAHLLLFRGSTLMDWIGTVIVLQSITSSLLDTQLFDFTQGWTYVFGVGVAGGMVRKLSGRHRGISKNESGGVSRTTNQPRLVQR